jgi:hypothetical protein
VTELQSLLFREAVVPGNRAVAELTAAFGCDGAVSVQRPGGCEAIGDMAEVIRNRTSIDRWIIAFGLSPDDLVEERGLGIHAHILRRALADMPLEELALVMAFLAAPTSIPGERLKFIPAAVRRLTEVAPTLPRPCNVALALCTRDVESAVATCARLAGTDLAFFIADDALGIRFLVNDSSMEFKAHHPVIQDELVAWCRSAGIDAD